MYVLLNPVFTTASQPVPIGSPLTFFFFFLYPQIDSLCRHVPLNTDRKGKIAWSKVVVAIKRDTGRPFGAGSTSKKWADLTSSGKVNKSHSARELRSQSGGDEGDGEEGESSPDVSGVADVSEEDLPSHKFPSQREEDVELRFFQGTGRTVFW